MRLAALSAAALIAATIVSTGSAFAVGGKRSPPCWGARALFSSTVNVNVDAEAASSIIVEKNPVVVGQQQGVAVEESQQEISSSSNDGAVLSLTAAEIKARFDAQLLKLREKDATSTRLRKEDIPVVFEDDHMIVVNKPSGVLTVSSNFEFPCLAQAVSEELLGGSSDVMSEQLGGCPDRMVVHRLGMDTSGLIAFAKTREAVCGMNAVFRNRMIERKYEALVCGVVEKEQGLIDLPIMRDYEYPPYVRISTSEKQQVLADLDPAVVGKKLLELPKDSLTKYEVIAREEFDGQPVTRVALTSISGRYHQLNVHMAAFGHPIVGDTTYGIHGQAAPNGGLSPAELEALVSNPNRASAELQQAIARAANVPCVHAKSLKFRHPVTNQDVSLSCNAPW